MIEQVGYAPAELFGAIGCVDCMGDCVRKTEVRMNEARIIDFQAVIRSEFSEN